jgi:uncharacterized protein
MELQVTGIPKLTFYELQEHLRLAKVNPDSYAHLIEPLRTENNQRNPLNRYRCLKCGHEACHTSQIRTARSFLSSFFNVQSARYSAVVCSRCSFTEFYQGRVSAGERAIDFALGS